MFGWSNRLQERWTKVWQQMPTSSYWKALPPECKYQVTKDKSLFNILTMIKGEKVYFPGRRYPKMIVRDNKFILPYSNNPGLNDLLKVIYKEGAIVRTSMDENKTAEIISMETFSLAGTDKGAGKDILFDPNHDFTSLGIDTDWVVEITAGRYAGQVVKVLEVLDKNRLRVSGYQSDNAAYRLVAPLYVTLSGDWPDTESAYIYPDGEALYQLDAPSLDANTHRALYPHYARRFAMWADVMSPVQKSACKSILDGMTDHVLYDRGISSSDSDEMLSAYLGAWAHALVDPARYNEIMTHPIMIYWRKKAEYMISLMSNPDDDFAMWFEGTWYSANTLKSLLQMAMYIEEFTGVDPFPELSKKSRQIAQGVKVEFVPGFSTMNQWSDVQWPYDVANFRRMDFIASVMDYVQFKDGLEDPELAYILNRIQPPIGSHAIDNAATGFSPFWNPFQPMVSPDYWETKPGGIYHNSKQGFVFAFSGWGKDSSVAFSSAYCGTGFDHDPNADNITLFRNGEWLLDWMRGYSSTDWETHYNCMTPCGEQIANSTRGEVYYKKGSNWYFQKGTRKGAFVKEQSRTVFYYRSKNGTDLTLVKDLVDIDVIPSKEALTALYKHEEVWQMETSSYKHQINWYMPTSYLTATDTTLTWAGNKGRKGYVPGTQYTKLYCLSSDFSRTIVENRGQAGAHTYPWIDLGSNKVDAMSGYSVRIVPNKNTGRVSFVSALAGYDIVGDMPEIALLDNDTLVHIIFSDGEEIVVDMESFLVETPGVEAPDTGSGEPDGSGPTEPPPISESDAKALKIGKMFLALIAEAKGE